MRSTASPTIRISLDTYQHLKERAEPFVDTPDSVIRRLLELDTDEQPQTPDDEVEFSPSEAAAAVGNGAGAAKPRPAAKARGSKSREPRHMAGKRRPRAPRGSLLKEEAYGLPILQVLAERGGRAGKNEVLDALEPLLADQLTELDRSRIASGEIRWRNRAQFVRLRLVERGEMERNSPRGIWELAEAGRARLEESRAGSSAAGAR